MGAPITSERAPEAAAPNSHAGAGGGLLFVSGQLPTDPATGKLLTGQGGQARVNARAALADAVLRTRTSSRSRSS